MILIVMMMIITTMIMMMMMMYDDKKIAQLSLTLISSIGIKSRASPVHNACC